MAEVNFVDGQALTPTSFGEIDPTTGVWVPKKYTGTYGTNGFYLPFSDGTSTTTLCYDQSGNTNHWTPTNISLTAGATYDWMEDTPTNNFAVLNPLYQSPANDPTAANLSSASGVIPVLVHIRHPSAQWKVLLGVDVEFSEFRVHWASRAI